MTSIIYTGGEITYNLSDYSSDEDISVLMNANTSGTISFTTNTPDTVFDKLINMTSAQDPVNVNVSLTSANIRAVNISGLSTQSYVDTTSQIQSLYVLSTSTSGQINVFYHQNPTEVQAPIIAMTQAQLILNEHTEATLTTPLKVYGADSSAQTTNTIWAGERPIQYSAVTITYSSTTLIYGGALEGNISIIPYQDPTDISNRLFNGQPTKADQVNVQDLILNVFQDPSLSPSYTVSNTATTDIVHIYQQTGQINFTGINAILALNNASVATTVSTLNLTGSDELWNGNGTATITTSNDNNILVNSGSGNLIVNNGSNTTTGTLSILNSGETGRGTISYTQGAETASILGQHSTLTATLGSGAATVDVGAYTDSFTEGNFSLTLGLGNLIIQNFTNTSATSPTSHNHIFLGSGQSVTQAVYDFESKNTVFQISNGSTTNTVTFENINLAGSNPFSSQT